MLPVKDGGRYGDLLTEANIVWLGLVESVSISIVIAAGTRTTPGFLSGNTGASGTAGVLVGYCVSFTNGSA